MTGKSSEKSSCSLSPCIWRFPLLFPTSLYQYFSHLYVSTPLSCLSSFFSSPLFFLTPLFCVSVPLSTHSTTSATRYSITAAAFFNFFLLLPAIFISIFSPFHYALSQDLLSTWQAPTPVHVLESPWSPNSIWPLTSSSPNEVIIYVRSQFEILARSISVVLFRNGVHPSLMPR